MDEHVELLRLFRIGQADLDANRLGRLGASESRRIRRQRIAGVNFAALVTALLVLWAIHNASNPGIWITSGVLALLVALPTAMYTVLSVRSGTAVTSITGTVSIDVRSAGRGGTIVQLKVADRAFNLPRPPGSVLTELPEAYGKVLTDQPYHIYVYRSTVVAMEPTTEGASLSIGQSVQPIPIHGYRPLKMNAFGIGVMVVGALIAVGLFVAGGFLMVVQFTGTEATATVESCVQDPDATTADSYICSGSWTIVGAPATDNASSSGTIQGTTPSDVGKTIGVRLSGGGAYEESLVLPIVISGLGLVMAFLPVAALLRARRRA